MKYIYVLVNGVQVWQVYSHQIKKIANGDYCFDNFCIDWKSPEYLQEEQKEQVNKFIKIMDKYRNDIKVSKRRYEEFEQLKEEHKC